MSDRLQFLAPSNPLRRAGYRYLIYFSLIVAMGGGFHFIGSYWILYRKTSSPASVAWLIMAYWVPSLFVMPFAGVIVDRSNRRLILAATCAYLALLSGTVTTLMATGLFRVEYLYPYGVLSSLALGVFWNALLAYLKDALTAEELLHANSSNTAPFQGGYLLGAGLAGVLFPWIEAVGCFSIDALSLASAEMCCSPGQPGLVFLTWPMVSERWGAVCACRYVCVGSGCVQRCRRLPSSARRFRASPSVSLGI